MKAFLSSQIISGDFANTVWRVRDAPAETPLEALLHPETWSHHSGKLKPYDEVIVVPQGAPYRAHLIVLDVGKNFAKMRLLDVKLLNAAPEEVQVEQSAPPSTELAEDAPVYVKWNGPNDKHTVFRRSDNEKLRSGFAIKADAVAWAGQHIMAMAA